MFNYLIKLVLPAPRSILAWFYTGISVEFFRAQPRDFETSRTHCRKAHQKKRRRELASVHLSVELVRHLVDAECLQSARQLLVGHLPSLHLPNQYLLGSGFPCWPPTPDKGGMQTCLNGFGSHWPSLWRDIFNKSVIFDRIVILAHIPFLYRAPNFLECVCHAG